MYLWREMSVAGELYVLYKHQPESQGTRCRKLKSIERKIQSSKSWRGKNEQISTISLPGLVEDSLFAINVVLSN